VAWLNDTGYGHLASKIEGCSCFSSSTTSLCRVIY